MCQYGYMTPAFSASPWWGEINRESSGCGGNEHKMCEKGWKWVKLGENGKKHQNLPSNNNDAKSITNYGSSTARRPNSCSAHIARAMRLRPPHRPIVDYVHYTTVSPAKRVSNDNMCCKFKPKFDPLDLRGFPPTASTFRAQKAHRPSPMEESLCMLWEDTVQGHQGMLTHKSKPAASRPQHSGRSWMRHY